MADDTREKESSGTLASAGTIPKKKKGIVLGPDGKP